MNVIACKSVCVCLLALSVWACSPPGHTVGSVAQSLSPQVTPKPKPYIAFLRDGDLWMIQSDGTNQRFVTAGPEGEAIQDFVWGVDGGRLYFSTGLRLFEVILQTGNLASAGELIAPP